MQYKQISLHDDQSVDGIITQKRKINSSFSVVLMRRVASIFFWIWSCKNFHAKILISRLFVIIVLFEKCAGVRHVSCKYLKKGTCKWSCIINFKQLQHSRTLSPSFKDACISWERSHKAPLENGFDEDRLL